MLHKTFTKIYDYLGSILIGLAGLTIIVWALLKSFEII